MKRRAAFLSLLTNCCVFPVDERRAESIHQLLSNPEKTISDDEWQSLILLAAENRIIPQLYLSLSSLQSSIPVSSKALGVLNTLYNKQVANSFQLSELLGRTLKVFAKNGVQAILIKGVASSYYGYQFPNIREMLDIDLLLADEAMVEKAKQLLQELGLNPGKVSHLQQGKSGFKFNYLCGGGPLAIDLHLAIGEGGYSYLQSSLIRSNAARTKIGANEALVSSPEDTLLITCAHAVGNGRFVLRDLLDILAVLNQKQVDWAYVLRRAHSLGLLFPFYSQLVLCSKLDNRKELEDPQKQALLLLPKRFRGLVLDASNFDESLHSMPLRGFRDNYFLPLRLGYTYSVRRFTTLAREMMQTWTDDGDALGGLYQFAVWKSKNMIKKAAEKLGSSRLESA